MKNTIVRVLVQILKNPPTPVGVPSQFYFRAKPLAKSKSKSKNPKSYQKFGFWILDGQILDLAVPADVPLGNSVMAAQRSEATDGYFGWFLGLAATGAGRCLNEPGKGGGKNVSTNGSFKILCVQNWEPKMALI